MQQENRLTCNRNNGISHPHWQIITLIPLKKDSNWMKKSNKVDCIQGAY